MGKIYGFVRISTKKQNIERQIRNILARFPEAIIYQEIYTGTKYYGRKVFEKLLSIVKPGDTIVFDSVSRMSRNAEEGFTLYKKLFEAGVNLIFLKEPHINTDTYRQALDTQLQIAFSSGDAATDELMDAIISALNKYIMRLAEKQIYLAFEQAQKEVDDLHQRTKEGILTAKANGKQIGRVAGRKVTTKKSIAAKEIIKKHSKTFGGTLKDNEVMQLARVGHNAYYKYKRELNEEL